MAVASCTIKERQGPSRPAFGGCSADDQIQQLSWCLIDDEFIFPSPVEKGGPITGHALTVAMRRLTDKVDGRCCNVMEGRSAITS